MQRRQWILVDAVSGLEVSTPVDGKLCRVPSTACKTKKYKNPACGMGATLAWNNAALLYAETQ